MWLLLLVTFATSAPVEEAVLDLPLWGEPPTKQYSGFLDASAAEQGTNLHYWFAEAEENPASAPVVLWLNGGPGSSSILGMLQEHGPLLISSSGGLFKNPYSWTRMANLLVLESPAGVGYSYCANQMTGGHCSNTDNSTASAARAALQSFFKKFPEFSHNKFYITGESYAGVYVPTLARELLLNAKEIRLVGLAVGDPCTDNDAQTESMDMLWYGHKNGFVPDEDFDFLWNTCGMRAPSGVDLPPSAPTRECEYKYRLFLGSTSEAFSQEWKHAWINDLTLYGPAAVVGSGMKGSLNYLTAQYMMREDTRVALHVSDAPAKVWPGPSDEWSYEKQYSACNPMVPLGTPSMVDIYRFIAPRLERVVVYNGDTDPCVSYEGTRTAIKKVGFPEVVGGAYRPWFFNATGSSIDLLKEKPLLFGPSLSVQEGGPQFAGHVVDYTQNLTFITIHGSGHMVPQFRPRVALHMLRKVLRAEQFAPLYPSEQEMAAFSDKEFKDFLDTWIVQAESSKYV